MGVVGVVAFAAIGGILFGLDQGNWGGAVVKDGFVNNFCHGPPEDCFAADRLPEDYAEFLSLGSSLLQLGAAVGALLIAPPFAATQGRRETMCFGSLITVAGAIPQSLVTDVRLFLLARFVAGSGVGVVTYALPMFVSEIAPANLRGALGCSMQLTMVLGTVFASMLNCQAWFGYALSFAMPAFPAAIIAFGIFSFPTSPRFALMRAARKGRIDDGVEIAWKALRSLRGSDAAAEEELAEIKLDLAEEAECSTTSWSELFREPSLRRRIIIANMLQWLQQFTGVNAILSYGPAIFQSAGVPLSGLECAVVTNMFNLAATFVMMLVIDLWGRRALLLLGAACMMVLMGVSALLAHALDHDWLGPEGRAPLGWALLCAICLYMASFAIAWGGVPWVYPSEIFPMAAKERALSTSVCSQWVANFLVAYLIPQQVQVMKVSGTFAFYACCLAVTVVLVYFFVPETKGLALEEMGQLFGEDIEESPTPVTDGFARQISGSSACSIAPLMSRTSTSRLRGRANTAPTVSLLGSLQDSWAAFPDTTAPRCSSFGDQPQKRMGRASVSFGSHLHMAPLGGMAFF